MAELIKLDKISKQAMWKKVLENQEIKKQIEETFKQIDEHMKDFQVPVLTFECLDMLI